MSKDFDPPIDIRRKVFLDGMRPRPPEVSAEIPTRLRVGKPRVGGLPHVLGWSLGPWIVSDKVKAVLEDLEPSVHKLSPIEILSEKTGAFIATYYLILDTPRVDCIDVKQTDRWEGGGDVGTLSMNGRIVLKTEPIRGRHFWKSEAPFRDVYFASDQLRARLKLEKLDGWHIERKCQLTGF